MMTKTKDYIFPERLSHYEIIPSYGQYYIMARYKQQRIRARSKLFHNIEMELKEETWGTYITAPDSPNVIKFPTVEGAKQFIETLKYSKKEEPIIVPAC